MSLLNCPECGNEVSNEAVACPNCGRPLIHPAPVIQPKVIVHDLPRAEGFPTWIIAPFVIVGAVVAFLLIVMMRNSDENSNTRNTNVKIGIQQKSSDSPGRTENSPKQIEVSSSSTTVDPPSPPAVPKNVPPTFQTDTSTVAPEKGLVIIEAKISTKNGMIQSVKNEKLYLLDKDLESILSDANLEPINGQSLGDSFGFAVLFPDKYGDFRRDALNAINKHIKYDATTNSGGVAMMQNVEATTYYLFGITKTRTGFAIWSSPVSITGGENKLNLSPAKLNEMSE